VEFSTLDTGAVSRTPERLPRVERDLARLRKVTGQVIGSVFFGTLLRTMRESTLTGPYGHGGRGEEVFASQLHDIYAEQVGTSVRNGVSQTVYKRLEHQQELYSGQRKLD